MRRSQRVAGLLSAVVVAMAVLVVPAVPGAANHAPPPESHEAAGAGSLEGTELVQDEAGFPCFRAARSVFGIRGAGTYEGRTAAGGPVVYRGQVNQGETLYANGPLQVQVENNEAYYHSPFGTHGNETAGGAGCSPSTVGTPVPAQFRIFSAEGTQDTDGDSDVDVLTGGASVYRLDESGAKVPCTGQGTFARGTNETPAFGDSTWVAEWTLSEDCVVVGNEAGTPGTGEAPKGTIHTHHGAHEPCFGDVTAGDCPKNIRVDYAQFFPKPGPFLTLSGPTSAGVGCDRPVSVTARLTVDGVAEPNVPVSFSVTGPAPTAPPGGAAITGADGRASFTFTALDPGDYTVAATATYNSQERVARHTVRYSELPPLTVSVAGPAKGQIGDPLSVTATVRDACGPLPAATVGFSVAWPAQNKPWTGQPTPPSGTAVTDANGRASFSFTGDRAGDYTVTASTSLLTGEEASADHTAHLGINTLNRVGALDLPEGEKWLQSALMDPAGRYAYFTPVGGKLVKIDLVTFERVGAMTLITPDNGFIGGAYAAVIDPVGRYAYYGVDYSYHDPATNTFNDAAAVLKVDLNTFEQVGTLQLQAGERGVQSAVIDPAGAFAYFATADFGGGGHVVKVELGNLARVGSLPLRSGESGLGAASTAVMDPAGNYAYFGTTAGRENGRVVKVDLSTFQVAAVETLATGEDSPVSAVIDPAGHFAYFATDYRGGRVVKVDLRTFRRLNAILLDASPGQNVAVIDPTGHFAYFGSYQRVIKVDLRSFEQAHAITVAAGETPLSSAVIDPAGAYAYFGNYSTQEGVPGKVVKVQLNRPHSPALAADVDAYATAYETPLTVAAPGVLEGDRDTADGDPLVAGNASDPAGGSVALNPDGSFSYTPDARFTGTDTFTYTASDGMDYSAPATVSVAVAPPKGPTGRAYGFYSSVSLFGGPAEPRGPSPTVTLPATGSATPVTATAPTGDAVYGPAKIFTSGQLDVSTQGTTESVTSSATVANVNRSLDEKFTAANVASTCTATASGVTASTTITNGVLQTSEGDPNVDGDETNVTIPTDPEPNTSYDGRLEGVGDRFRYVFNEQVRNPDGSITVYAAHQYLLGPTAVGDLYIGKSECGVPTTPPPPPVVAKVVADFDGNGTTDRSVFRAGAWYAEGQDTAYLGLAGDIAVPGDYDGNGTTDRAVYRDGAWFVEGQPTVYLGLAEDVPVPADYDGDGSTDRAVYRPSVGAWYIKEQAPVYHGAPGDIPVPGDYDGNGAAEVGVFRPESGGWYVFGQDPVFLGLQGDIPVPGDFDGNGSTDRAVYRGGAWFTDGQAPVYLGLAGDVPVPGSYDTGATTDRAVWRPAAGAWHLDGQPPIYLGAEGDVPLPLPAAIHRAFF